MPPVKKFTPDEWAVLYEAHSGNLAAMSRATGMPRTSLYHYRDQYSRSMPTEEPTDFQGTVLEAAKKHTTILDLADALDCSPRRVTEAIEGLKSSGFNVSVNDGVVSRQRVIEPDNQVHIAQFDGLHSRFGILSDTHEASKQAKRKEVQQFYRILKSEGVPCAYHAGDMITGSNVYRGQENEITVYGQDEQVDLAVNYYPDDVDTYVIGGNHDLAEYIRGGSDPLVQIAARRPDIHYLGKMAATVEFPRGVKMELVHPDKGGSYALSYLPQRYIDNMEGGNKPNIIVFGHWHISMFFERRNIYALCAGCFEGQTSYLKRKGIQPSIGGYICEINIAEDGSVNRFSAERIKFF